MENPHKAHWHNLFKMVPLTITRAVPQLAMRMRKKEQDILVRGEGGGETEYVFMLSQLRPTGLNPAPYSVRKVECILCYLRRVP